LKSIVFFEDIQNKTYQEVWDYQSTVQAALVNHKRYHSGRERSIVTNTEHRLIFCEHSPVFTLGKSGSEEHLLLNKSQLQEQKIEYFKINRGGDITYHGPGQITGYPILDLADFKEDVRWYVESLEQVIIDTIAHFGIVGTRINGYTGVWIKATNNQPNRKICALGVHMSRWVTLHGFAFNVNTDLSYFDKIIPCGIVDDDKAVTSLQSELGAKCDMAFIKSLLKSNFKKIFNVEINNYESIEQ
jgi:lipoyl(octanoyl) transferase